MSENESDLSQRSSESDSESQNESEDGDFGAVTSHSIAYGDEPLALPGEEVNTADTDEDGLSPLVLEMRSDKRIPLDEWCSCQNCHGEKLVGILEYRCCKEMMPAVRIMTFDGSIERVHCITQHDDFTAMINPTVLEQVGPFLKDRNGRSYRRRGGQNINNFLRAVAYRWLIKWMCGLLGWENSRPLPACVYHKIRTQYPTQEPQGYIPSEKRT